MYHVIYNTEYYFNGEVGDNPHGYQWNWKKDGEYSYKDQIQEQFFFLENTLSDAKKMKAAGDIDWVPFRAFGQLFDDPLNEHTSKIWP